jgi:hypothetical protein
MAAGAGVGGRRWPATSAPGAPGTGRAVSVSDVSGLEGPALTAGTVVFVPGGPDRCGGRPGPGWARRSQGGCATPASRSTNIRDQVIWIHQSLMPWPSGQWG